MRGAAKLWGILLCILVVAAPLLAQQNSAQKLTPQEFYKLGHSAHGDAFDVGPREKPWEMEGIGKTHFPITTSKAEVQKWFNQGHTLLHSFWYYEAERAFRWCLRLDPDCAMAYWGLARSSGDRERSAAFIKEASRRKHKVSERERLYIEAWEELYAEQPKEQTDGSASSDSRREKFKRQLDKIILKYPDDMEARALYALENLWSSSRYGNELILQSVLARDPQHPGAHHYRIHNWDGHVAEHALDSSRLFGRIAPNIGHAQHMPGHIFSGVGMWHEGAISMDSATRVEAAYMRRRLTFPFNTWNYNHNRNYLGYILEQLGMPEAAIRGAKELLAAPHDPKFNNPDRGGTHWQGMTSLMRALVKFERWKEILDGKTVPWRDSVRDKFYKSYCETQAHLGLGNLEKAIKSFNTHADLKKEIQKGDNKWLEETYTIQSMELQGLLHLARGESLTGLGLLASAAKRELEHRARENDPPFYPNVPIYNTLGYAYLAQKSPALAVAAFDKTLEVVRNDAFALSGLVQAYAAIGEEGKARDAYARLLYVWSDAEPGLKWMERAKAVGLKAEPKDSSPAPQRNFKRTALDHLGPHVWESYEAPQLQALDSKGKRVTLEEYRGKNVLLIFYLGDECPHCLDQLIQIGKKKDEFGRLNTEILAISSDTPEENAASLKLGEVPFRLLSDVKFENTRRFKSYDDFEDIALHSTILIDSRGRVHWARNGGDPFTDFEFLLKEIRRLNQILTLGAAVSQPVKPASAR